MPARSMLIAAVAVYATVLGCVLIPPATSSSHLSNGDAVGATVHPAANYEGLPFIGAGIQIQRVDWMDKYKQSMDEIAAVGGDTVLLVVDARQENGSSNKIYLDMRMTPTPEQLASLIRHAKSKNLRVVVMPIVLLDSPRSETEWRGSLKPENWEKWFDSYREMISQFAWIADGNGADVLVVGSELVTTESHLDEWTKTIRAVRKLFHGKITYSSNWDHYTSVSFWDQLDLIGLNAYWNLSELDGKSLTRDEISVDQLNKRWKEIQSPLLAFSKSKSRPMLITEAGWFSQSNTAKEAWDYTRDQPLDLELQKMIYQSFFQSWWGNPNLGGFMIWEWNPGDGGPADKGYTPENKPAEKVLREYFAKKRWEVKP